MQLHLFNDRIVDRKLFVDFWCFLLLVIYAKGKQEECEKVIDNKK